jgi:hypothetical protein
VHRTTRSLSIAAAVITVGALALPVSAALADTQSSSASGGSSVAAPDDATTTTSSSSAEDTETDAPEVEAPETEAPHADAGEASDATVPSPSAPSSDATTPWHVKARLIDRDSAVVTWRDTDSADTTTFSVTLVPFGGAAASALPAVPAAGSARSVQIDGLTAGTRYRATVTATTTGGSAVSASSNVVVAPKAKHGKGDSTATKAAEHGTTRAAKPARTVSQHESAAKAEHAGKPAHAKRSAHHGG